MSKDKIPTEGINKIFEQRYRLAIMTLLCTNDSLDFVSLKSILDLSDGNLSVHLKTLVDASYIHLKKSFINNKPNTLYSITVKGKKEFLKHIENLKKLIDRI